MKYIEYADLVNVLPKTAAPQSPSINNHGIWSNGESILCSSEEQANHIADFIEALGCGDAVTGYYDPEEDKQNNCVDRCTGFWYVEV